jgi:PIN domain nuclease of toxin-antitoxin system
MLKMIVCDTNALIYDALEPTRLSKKARQAIDQADENNTLGCSDISLWEIAMLIAKKRLEINTDACQFINDILISRRIKVLPISAEIAVLSQNHETFNHKDPADRLIAATALHHKAKLVTCDTELQKLKILDTIW